MQVFPIIGRFLCQILPMIWYANCQKWQLINNCQKWQLINKWLDKSYSKKLPTMKISTYSNYGSSFPFSFTAFNLNLFECLHFCISSVFAFMQFASAFRIQSFSDKQTSHFLVPLLYGLHFFMISHLMVGVSPASFSLQTYVDRLVAVFALFLPIASLWFGYLFLNVCSVAPIQCFSSFSLLTVAL